MDIIETKLPGVLILQPKTFIDSRGMFFECFQTEKYSEYGIKLPFVQDNFSRSAKNVLRGMHYQFPNPQGKLIWVTRGAVFDVVVDIRRGSPTFGNFCSINLSAEKIQQIYIPPGFAHGFCSLTDDVDFHYKCTDYFYPQQDHGFCWNDPDVAIPWPVKDPILSPKDTTYARLRDIPSENLPAYE